MNTYREGVAFTSNVQVDANCNSGPPYKLGQGNGLAGGGAMLVSGQSPPSALELLRMVGSTDVLLTVLRAGDNVQLLSKCLGKSGQPVVGSMGLGGLVPRVVLGLTRSGPIHAPVFMKSSDSLDTLTAFWLKVCRPACVHVGRWIVVELAC